MRYNQNWPSNISVEMIYRATLYVAMYYALKPGKGFFSKFDNPFTSFPTCMSILLHFNYKIQYFTFLLAQSITIKQTYIFC